MISLFRDSDDDSEETFPWMEGDSLAPPCQSDMEVVNSILEFAELTENDVLFDLGCGDGRICIAASEKFGIRSCGVEIEEVLVERFKTKLAEKRLEELVRVEQGDLTELDLSDATVIVLYLLPEGMQAVKAALVECLQRGCRVICNSWGIPGIEHSDMKECGQFNQNRLFLYTSASVANLVSDDVVVEEDAVVGSSTDTTNE